MPLLISLKVACIATTITFFIGIWTAYAMAQYRGRGASLIDSVLLLPLVLPPTVIGFGLLWLLGDRGPFAFLPLSIVFTWWAAVLTAVVVALPLMYRSSRAAFEQIDSKLLGAARTLGASEWRLFWQIAMPLARPGIISGTLLSFARALGEFGATLMLAGNIPGKTQTLPMAVYFAVEGGDLRTAAGWSGMMVAIALFIVTLSNHFIRPSPSRRKQKRLPSVSAETQPGLNDALNQKWNPQTLTRHLFLSVDITKQLPNFMLRVQFESADALVAILGASGAGKSLLLRCLAGIETPDAGRILLGDRVLYDSAVGIDVAVCDRHIALLFQNYALFPHLTVYENVAFGLRTQQGSRASQLRQQVLNELAAVQLQNFAYAYPHQLSGGQQQRVALARALVCQPQLLLLDEPFSALDTYLRSRLSQQLFDRLQKYQGSTILVTHDLEQAYRAQQLVVLLAGQSVRCGKPGGIFAQPKTRAIAQLTGPINCTSIQPADLQPAGQHVFAKAWKMTLQLSSPQVPNSLKQDLSDASSTLSVGIRPQNVSLITTDLYQSDHTRSNRTARVATCDRHSEPPTLDLGINQAPCWPANHRLQPQSVTLFLKLHGAAIGPSDYHLQAILTHQRWEQLQQQRPPWIVQLLPEYLIVLRS